MNMDKKGNFYIIMSVIILFAVMGVFIIAIPAMIKETADDYVFDELVVVSQDMEAQGDISSDIHDHNVQTDQDFKDFDWKPDLYFMAILLSLFMTTIYSAVKTRKTSWWSFSGYMTLGMMFFLFLVGIISTIAMNFYELFFNQVLERFTFNTPIFDWFMGNMNLVCFIWAVLLLLINQIEFGVGESKFNKDEVYEE